MARPPEGPKGFPKGFSKGFRRALVARVWALLTGEADGGRRHLPTLWNLLEWLEPLELANGPFGLDVFRTRLSYVMGVEVEFVSARGALYGRVQNPEAAYQILKGELISGGGINGAMIRDPATEDATILTPGDLRTEEELKPPLHELMHVALGDPVEVPEDASFPEEARPKLRAVRRPDGEERLFWLPESKLFPAPRLFDDVACEQRAEVLAGYALLASVYGGDSLRDAADDDFWS